MPAQFKICGVLFLTRAAENTAGFYGRTFKIGDHVIGARKIGRVNNPHFGVGFPKWNIAQTALCVFIKYASINPSLP